MLTACESVCNVASIIGQWTRVLICIVHNLYCIPAYLLICLLLSPLYLISIECFSFFENNLYMWLLTVVSSWSHGCGLVVNEHGDDIKELINVPNIRVLVVANHQSTADVPLMMQAFTQAPRFRLLWVMDALFKWTNFGFVSQMHGDYFLSTKNYVNGSLLNHCTNDYSRVKNLIILFPEGGFRYKRIQSSQSFASKRNYPLTQYVSYPRINGYRELLDPIMGITHVVDLTIAYDDSEDTPSMLDILRGRNLTSIHFHYRVYPVNECPNIRTENWLYERWQMKEAMLNNHYKAIKINDEQSSNSVAALTTDNEGDCANKFHKELNNGGVGENSLDCGGHHSNQRDNNNLPASNPAATTTNYPFKSHHQFASLHFNLDEGRPIKFSYFKVVLIHLFYILVNVFVYQICALIF